MFPDLTRDDVFRIETRRLWLRWPCARDAEAVLRLAGDPAVAEMTARIPHPLPRAEVDAFLLRTRGENAAGTGLTLALARRSAPADLVGIVGVVGGAAGPEIGYWLGKPHWGAGLMGEAVAAVTDAFFAYAGGDVLRSSARTDNPASRGVLERCGFVRTGSGTRAFPERGADLAVDLFSLDRARWQALSCDVAEAA
jgi:RimJ/RimL family protein N-acetyltransferase